MTDKDVKAVADKHGDRTAKTSKAPDVGDGNRLTVPDGDVLVRYVKGPAKGNNSWVGWVELHRVYTIDEKTAALLCFSTHQTPQFELVYEDDRRRVEAASKTDKKD